MSVKQATRYLCLAALPCLAATAARAQGFGLDVEAGYRTLAATKSATAIFGSDGGTTFGGSAQYAFGNGIFVRAGARTFSEQGERVFLADASSTPYPLGFPLEVKITSIDVLAGWRLRLGSGRKPSRFVPYAAIGVEFASYEEESTVAGLVETNDASKTGFQGVVGLEARVIKGLCISAEGGYSTVSSALGVGGVSKIYGEDDIGGFRVVGRLGYRF
ncbi:MAG TPA: outer membrane beta-barrel protein [Vicinamibacteria bacterium]